MKNNQTTERLLAASRTIWEGYLTHPFVQGIADGSLAAEKFRFYLLQDYLYLFDYAKVFAQGVVKSREPEVMRTFASYVSSILNGEMAIHRGYMKRLGITERTGRACKTFAQQPVLYRLYACGLRPKKVRRRLWRPCFPARSAMNTSQSGSCSTIRMLRSTNFTASGCKATPARNTRRKNVRLTGLLEHLTAGYTEPQLAHLTDIFVDCSRFEAMFWDMAWNEAM